MLLNKIIDKLNINLDELLSGLIKGIIFLILGYIIVKIIMMILKRLLYRSKLDRTVANFLFSVIKAIIYLIYTLGVLSTFGIPLTGVTAILTASGVAISLALQDSLSNIANGMMIIFSKPFKSGDYISVEEIDGTVVDITMSMTKLITPDNKQITIPNTKVFKANIINYTAMDFRRLDMEFFVDLYSDVARVKKVLHDTVMSHPLVMKTKNPMINVKEYKEKSLIFICRAWVQTDDYWDLRWEIYELIQKSFLDNEIIIPYDKLDIRILDNHKE